MLSTKNCEYVLQYTYILSLIYVLYGYKDVIINKKIYYFDILGYILVSISSYLYHNALYHKLVKIYPKTNVDVLELTNVYLFDILCINIRTWLTCYVHFTAITGYLTNYRYHIIIFMGIIHIITYSLYCYFIYDLKYKKNTFTLDCETNSIKIIIINILIGLPIMLTITFSCINCINTDNEYYTYYLFLYLYINAIILFIKPFYQLNHLVIHILLIFLSIILVNQNI